MSAIYGDDGSIGINAVIGRGCVIIHDTKVVKGHARFVEVHKTGAVLFSLAYLVVVVTPAVEGGILYKRQI